MPIRQRKRIITKKGKPVKRKRLVVVKRKRGLAKKAKGKPKRKVVRPKRLIIEESSSDSSSDDSSDSDSDSSSEDEKPRRRHHRRRKTKRTKPVPRIFPWPLDGIATGLTSARCRGISQASCDADPQCVATNWGCRDRPGVGLGARYEGPMNRPF